MPEVNRKHDMSRKPPPFTVCPLLEGEENAGILLDYCNHKLAPEMAHVFELHMEKCPACAAFAESQMAVWNALDSFEAMPVSGNFDQRLRARIEFDQQDAWWNRAWSRITASGATMWRPAVPVAAALILAAGLWMRPGGISTPPAGNTVAKGEVSLDVEQIETALEDMEMLRELAAADTATRRL
ncbi:MAG TPA: hypothetical protein VM120_08820 [Bryobacteraceae bacterium]|nr:hypothetical protein [Bryobacteraceae bacterium]